MSEVGREHPIAVGSEAAAIGEATGWRIGVPELARYLGGRLPRGAALRAQSDRAWSRASPSRWRSWSSSAPASRNVIGALAPGVNYIQFMYPGIIAMTVLTTSLFAGISVVWDREFGFLKEILVAPIGRTGIVLRQGVRRDAARPCSRWADAGARAAARA